MMMKREREVDSIAMANYLMMLSGGGGKFQSSYTLNPNFNSNNSRVFECKTCNRQFSSFQALGGHRASHKKPRLLEGSSDHQNEQSVPQKPKTHECSVCGLEFAIGQALGGHMRRHRSSSSSGGGGATSSNSSGNNNNNKDNNNSSKRVLFLDLNLTPLENDLEFLKIGQAARPTTPLVHCFN